MEDGEVEGKAELCGIVRRKLVCSSCCLCVVIKRFGFDLFEFLASDTFGNVSIVIRDHFEVKGLAVGV